MNLDVLRELDKSILLAYSDQCFYMDSSLCVFALYDYKEQ